MNIFFYSVPYVFSLRVFSATHAPLAAQVGPEPGVFWFLIQNLSSALRRSLLSRDGGKQICFALLCCETEVVTGSPGSP